MNQKKNLLTAALAVLTAFSSVSAQGGEDGGSTYEKFRVGGYGEMVANFKDYGINRYWLPLWGRGTYVALNITRVVAYSA